MLNPAVENILEKGQSRYSLVIAVAKRAREIADDCSKKGEILIEKPVQMAIEDFAEQRYHFIECEDA